MVKNKTIASKKQIIAALKRSNQQLENFIEYASETRNKVMRTLNTAYKYGYTYVDLDTIDGARCQVIQNKELIKKLSTRKAKS